MERAEKEEQVKTLTDYFTKAPVALCAEYRGLTVLQITELRKELRKSGAIGKVYKNTIVEIAVKNALKEKGAGEAEKFANLLTGPNMFIFSLTDPVAPAKVLAKFAKGNDKLKLKGGLLEKGFIDGKGVEALSTMPGRQELYAMLVRTLAAPATNVVRVLNASAEKLVRVLNAQAIKLEGETK